ncbi:ABC transporter substrate-binding protein [Plantactinospora sp. KBS50]|uniref:ABC transporter substrate-binding protein n=1 Tax=Plantactinospora sp. KBS50 TaxID=2024580 RepID=UPI001E338842|nr:extracellular solute-binding protein [Plantactinospora sp. KBS50]
MIPLRTTSRPRLRAALLALLLVITVTGCQDGSGPPTEDGPVQLSVFWYGNQRRAQLTEQALQAYTRKHPKVTFRVTWQGVDGYYQRLATQAAGGNPPDLFQLDEDYLAQYAQRQIALDLTEFVDHGRIDLSRLSPSLVQYGTVDGRVMAVAAAENTPALIFNRSLLRRLGLDEPSPDMTYEEYVQWARQVTLRSNGRVAGTMDPSADIRALWVWLRAGGVEFYRGQQLGFTVTDLARWFEFWQDARIQRATPAAAVVQPANSPDPTRQLVVTGRTAASIAWSHQLGEMQRNTTDQLGITALPGAANAQWARASMYWGAYRGTRHATVVADVINFLTNDPEAGRILGDERGLSANIDIRQSVLESLDDPAAKLSAMFETGMSERFGPAPPPPPPGHDQVRTLLRTAAEKAQSGRETSRAAAAEFVQEANAVLAG